MLYVRLLRKETDSAEGSMFFAVLLSFTIENTHVGVYYKSTNSYNTCRVASFNRSTFDNVV